MSPQHSTLELVKHDKTLGAPERDYSQVAPESDLGQDAPQAAPDTGAEIVYGDAVPEIVPSLEKTGSAKARSRTSSLFHASPRSNIAIIALAVAIVVGAAVGAGVGAGLRKKGPTRGSPTVVAGTTIATSTIVNTALPPSSTPPPLTDMSILNDTSVSALILPNGDRRLFFQEFSGRLRQAFYSTSTRQWRADIDYIVASDARNNTPIAAVNVPTVPENYTDPTSAGHIPGIPGGLAVFYIRLNGSLACSVFAAGAWTTVDEGGIYFYGIAKYAAPQNSRHLSLVIVPGKPIRLLNVYLAYETDHGTVSMLNGSLNLPPEPDGFPFWTWDDVSDKLNASNKNTQLRFGVPSTTLFQSEFVFAATDEAGSSQALYTEVAYDNSSTLFTSNSTAGFDSTAIQNSDILMVSVNGTSLDMTGGPQSYGFTVEDAVLASFPAAFDIGGASLPSIPSTPFPYGRIDGFSTDNTSNLFIYHQLNYSHFAEEQWDPSVGGWISNSFPIAGA